MLPRQGLSFPPSFLLTVGGSLYFSCGQEEKVFLWPCGFFVLSALPSSIPARGYSCSGYLHSSAQGIEATILAVFFSSPNREGIHPLTQLMGIWSGCGVVSNPIICGQSSELPVTQLWRCIY